MYIFLLATEIDDNSTILTVALERTSDGKSFANQRVLCVSKQSQKEAAASSERILQTFSELGCHFISSRSFCLAKGKNLSYHIREFEDSVVGTSEAENTKLSLLWMDSKIKDYEDTLKQMKQNRRILKEHLESLPCQRRQKSLESKKKE
ncbi:hypothetical protein LAU_0132 [Lausannevirus]|uniref:Uncharacterized protein n=2 Tax=Lausannevirus TaxID=999883 RepID=A0A0N9PVF5_9VIRU|nr:hypothetical protein LAU_0132 [Lausannevirus]AEA06983.1 hypothetical protein LAU_0132 [Lausannevirus]ALH06813.1 hypothetical protein PMV_115 [Port-miou virus]